MEDIVKAKIQKPIVFAFGQDGRYLYQVHDETRWSNLPHAITYTLNAATVLAINWAAFGTAPEAFFISYLDKDGDCKFVLGESLPFRLKEWLEQLQSLRYSAHQRAEVRLVLGPKESYVAWRTSGSAFIWESIPIGLERTIRTWRTPSGWAEGAPRFLAIGASGSYLALRENGDGAWYFPDTFKALKDVWQTLWSDPKFEVISLAYVSFDATRDDKFIVIQTGESNPTGAYHFSTSQGIREINMLLSYNHLIEPERHSDSRYSAQTIWVVACKSFKPREPNEILLRRGEYVQIIHKPSEFWWYGRNIVGNVGYFPAKYVKTYGRILETEENPAAILYHQWKTAVDAAFHLGNITAFPYLPSQVCLCRQLECTQVKAEGGGLKACRHDVERILRASGSYSPTWLKKERLQWHPDRFGQRCQEDHRDKLVKKSEQLFVIFGLLYEDLKALN